MKTMWQSPVAKFVKKSIEVAESPGCTVCGEIVFVLVFMFPQVEVVASRSYAS